MDVIIHRIVNIESFLRIRHDAKEKHKTFPSL